MNYKIIKNYIYLIVILLFIFFIYNYIVFYENFDSCNSSSLNYQHGVSSTSPSGSIKFNKPFDKIPIILTQIKTDDKNIKNNAYSIQIFNVTNYGFDYNKKKIFNQNSDDINIVRLGDDSEQIFFWIAL